MIKLILSLLLLIFVHFSFAVNIKSNKISSKKLVKKEIVGKIFSSFIYNTPAIQTIKLIDTQDTNKFYYLEYETLNVRWAKQSINRAKNKNYAIGMTQSLKKLESDTNVEIEDRKNWLYKFNY
jgi:hypothetical protein